MGFFDDIFGGFFDFNGDGKTSWDEEWIAFKIMQDVEKQQKAENPNYDAVLLDDDELDRIMNEPLYDGDEVDDPYLREIAALDEYGWREIVEPNDYGIEPEDYETEEEYFAAVEEAETLGSNNSDVSINIPIKLTFSVEMPLLDALDAIKEEDYPNKRQYNAAYRKTEIESGLAFGLNDEEKKHSIEQCKFVLEQHDKCIAANYLSVMYSEFLYAQAIKENFDLPIDIPNEDEQMITSIDDLFRQIYPNHKDLMFAAWKWCVEKFVPYMKYASDDGYNLSTNIIAHGAFIDDDFTKSLAEFFAKNPAFAKIILTLSPYYDTEYGALFVELMKLGSVDLAVDLFKICLAKDIQDELKIIVISGMFTACQNYEELETMELFEKYMFPLFKDRKKGVFEGYINTWEKEMEDYFSHVERICEQYRFTRRNAWRKEHQKEAEEFGINVLNYDNEADYLTAYNNKKEFREKEIERKKKIAEQQAENLRKMQTDKTIYSFVGVVFPSAMHPYHYLTNDESITIGDKVVVPVGADNREEIGEVVSVEKHLRVSAPFPVDKTKYVLRKHIAD